MSCLITLVGLASNTAEDKIVTKLSKGLDLYPQNMFSRGDYYKKIYDQSVNNMEITTLFRKNFSMFVSKYMDTMQQLKEN